MAEVKAHFRPEFVNRIDEIVVFHPLDEDQIANIARIQLRSLEQRLAKLECASTSTTPRSRTSRRPDSIRFTVRGR